MIHRRSGRALLVLAAFVLFLVPVAAIAAGDFTDVEDSSVFKADIDWLADAGVTKGCNPPSNTRFCPGNDVTREQMAAFMHRLAANQVVDAATAIEAEHAATADEADQAADAALLDGMDSTEFVTPADLAAITPIAASASEGNVGTLASNNGSIVLSVTIEAPVAGLIQITAGALIDPPVAAGRYHCNLSHGAGAGAVELPDTDRYSTLLADEYGSCSTNGGIDVPAGSHVINLELSAPLAATTVYDDATLDAIFIPGGSMTVQTASASASDD